MKKSISRNQPDIFRNLRGSDTGDWFTEAVLSVLRDTDHLLPETSEDDEGRETRGEGRQGEAAQQLGQQERRAAVDPFPGLLIVSGSRGHN